jgi:hypothetical protein
MTPLTGSFFLVGGNSRGEKALALGYPFVKHTNRHQHRCGYSPHRLDSEMQSLPHAAQVLVFLPFRQ